MTIIVYNCTHNTSGSKKANRCLSLLWRF